MKLFKEILLEVAPLLTHHNLTLEREELVDFCIDIYNNVVSMSHEKDNRSLAIQLSIRSLTKVLEQSLKQKGNTK